jgi:hypothetical protein
LNNELSINSNKRDPMAVYGMGCRFPGEGVCTPQKYFEFLSKKDNSAWKWIKNANEDTIFSFISGYTDAEGIWLLDNAECTSNRRI